MYANLSKYDYETFICGCHLFVYINIHFGKNKKQKNKWQAWVQAYEKKPP